MQRPVNREAGSPMGAYQVWHREGAEFRHVGSLKVGNLLAAAEVSMNRPPATWMDGQVPEAQRRTRTEDVIVSPDGGAFKLKETTYGFTFEAVSFEHHRQHVKDAAEYREELQAGVRDALTITGAKFEDVLREAAWHGMKGDDVAAIREGVEKERDQGGIRR